MGHFHARFLATGGRTFAERGLAYDIPSFRVDGNDFLALYSVTKWARERASAGHGPTHIEVYTYRAGAHSSSDDPSAYRPGNEFECWPGGDPVKRLRDHLMKIGEWDEEKDKALAEKIDNDVMTAYKEACEFGDLASAPILRPPPSLPKSTKPCPGTFKSSERSSGSEVRTWRK